MKQDTEEHVKAASEARPRHDSDDASDKSGQSGSSCTDGTSGSTSTATSSTRQIPQSHPLKLSALPFSRLDISFKNTFVEDYTDDDCEQVTYELRPRADSEWTGLLRLASKDPEDDNADGLRTISEVVTDNNSEVVSQVSDSAGGEYAWMICRVQIAKSPDGTLVTSVLPCTTEDAAAVAQAAGEEMAAWCWLQPDGEGSMLAIPCSDRPLDMVEEAPTAAELACAPPPPATGSYRPAWVPRCTSEGHVCSPPTTLALGNLPPSLTQEALLEVLDRAEFSGFYDFVFLEADLVTGSTCGTALVNCTRHTYALAMAAKFQGRASWPTDDEDDVTIACEVQWSLPFQGRDSLVDGYRDHPLNEGTVNEEMRPQLFKDGWPLPFPGVATAAPAPAHAVWNVIQQELSR